MIFMLHDGSFRDFKQQPFLQLSMIRQIASQPRSELIGTQRASGNIDRQDQIRLLLEQWNRSFKYRLIEFTTQFELFDGRQELTGKIIGAITRNRGKQFRMQTNTVIKSAGRLRLEAPQVPSDGILYQIAPSQTSHQPLINTALHDYCATTFITRFAQGVVGLGQQR